MRNFGFLLIALLASPAPTLAQEPPYIPPAEDVIAVTLADLTWQEGPQGRKVAVLYGNPTQEGPCVLRVKFPANHEIPLHWHPTTEFATILAGTVYFAVGRDADRSTAVAYGPGTFLAAPANLPIRGWTADEEVVVQVHGMGPLHTIPLEPRETPGSK